jgi:hypothetical protein
LIEVQSAQALTFSSRSPAFFSFEFIRFQSFEHLSRQFVGGCSERKAKAFSTSIATNLQRELDGLLGCAG